MTAGARPSALPAWYPDRRFVPVVPDMWRRRCVRVMTGLLSGCDDGPTREALRAIAAVIHPAWSRVLPDAAPGVAGGVAWRVAEGILGYRPLPVVQEAGLCRLAVFEPASVDLYAFGAEHVRALNREGVRLADAVCWSASDPGSWALERGAFAVLGEQLWEEARFDRDWGADAETLRLHASPESWAAAAAERGVCLLDRPVPAHARRRLRRAARIACDGPAHAAEVHTLVRRERRSPLPDLHVPVGVAA